MYRKYESAILAEEVSDLSERVDEIVERLPLKFENTGIVQTREGTAILKSNGQYYSSSGGSATDLIPINRSEDWYVTGRMIANSATIVAYYDSNEDFIGTQFAYKIR